MSVGTVVGSPKRPYQVITAGGGFDLTPSLSPDGAMVAYASLVNDRPGTSILVKTTNNAYPRVLDTRAPGRPTGFRRGRRMAVRSHSSAMAQMAAAAS